MTFDARDKIWTNGQIKVITMVGMVYEEDCLSISYKLDDGSWIKGTDEIRLATEDDLYLEDLKKLRRA